MQFLMQRLNDELSALETTLEELTSDYERKDSYSLVEVDRLVLYTKLLLEISCFRLLEGQLIQAMEASPSIPESEQEKS
jgi:hypothetical protein